MSTKLIRESVGDGNSLEELVSEEGKKLASRAAKELGYEAVHNALSEREAAIKRGEESFAKATEIFDKVGIQPYSTVSVNAYKESVLTKFRRKFWFHNFVNSKTVFDGLMPIGAIVGIVSTIGTFIWTAGYSGTVGHFAIPPYSWLAQDLAVTGLLNWWGFAFVRVFLKNEITFRWDMHSLHSYSNAVPDFALAHALAIKDVVKPGTPVGFYVNTLEKHNSRGVRMDFSGDPFLVVEIGTKQFYVDVWDEAKFEGRKIL